ncbi:MAG: hypothetical protein Q4D51_05075 [Eubacteriales bacterium]|nr:hypothetical protein [Eubacteriales bacterium]
MKQTKVKFSLLLLLIVVMGCSLMGCGTFPASKYVQSCLDCSFHGEFASYMEMTKSSEEEVSAAYNQLIDSEVSALSGAYNVSDEQKEKFRALFIDMYKLCKYEVGEATNGENKSYSVPVTTYKLKIFDGLAAETEKFAADYFEKNQEATPDELYAAVLDNMYDILQEKIKNPEYEEGVTTTITVAPSATDSNVYTISPQDLQNMVSNLLDIENQQ